MVFDRFHIMRHVVEAVNTVRKREHKELRKSDEPSFSACPLRYVKSVAC
jgi:hypothetical protein